jgi:LPXTG-motif cell wall-anchored protein
MLAHLAAFAALLPAAAAPAALAPAVAAATDVTIAWTSDPRSAVVTWQEADDQADHITLNTLDGQPVEGYQWDLPVGHPNEFAIGLPVDEDLRVVVQPVDAAGQPVGDAARSAAFDTDQTAKLTLTGALPRADGTVLMTWKATPIPDDTPNDPLDLPPTPIAFVPFGVAPQLNETVDLVTTPITATSFVVPARQLPEQVGLRTVPNEFGSDYAASDVQRTDLTASIPRTATTGRTLQVTGVSKLTSRACDPGICFTQTFEDAGRVLHLEARTGATAPWQTVATATTATKTGKYRFRITSPGTRDYRVVAEPVGWQPGSYARSYAATATITTRSGSASDGGGGEDDGGLPITGAPAAWIAAAGALLVALGAALVAAGRRRRRATV